VSILTNQLKGCRLFLGALCRDAEPQLPGFKRFLQSILPLLASLQVVVVENDSMDGSFRELCRLQKRWPKNLRLIQPGSLDRRFLERTDRIAFCRNLLLEEFRLLGGREAFDLVLMLDIAPETAAISPRCIDRALALAPPNWSALTANHAAFYYDIWALRHALWCPFDVSMAFHEHKAMYGEEFARRVLIASRQIHLPAHLPPVAVDSAFAGAGLYRSSILEGCSYAGHDDLGHPICEHVTFHQLIRSRGGLIYIQPAFIVSRGISEHGFWGLEWMRFGIIARLGMMQLAFLWRRVLSLGRIVTLRLGGEW
jgi:hypothetical protein